MNRILFVGALLAGTCLTARAAQNFAAQGSALIAAWPADGAGFASFSDSDLNPTRRTFVADATAGGSSTVQSWGLQMNIMAVPEVETWVAAALAGMFGAFWLHRQIMNDVNKDKD